MSNKFVLSDHAREEASRRGIDETTVQQVAEAPEQIVPVRLGRTFANPVSSFRPTAECILSV